MIPFYKPNPKNTGTACSFSYKPKDGTFFVSLIKQFSWDAQRKTGSFTQNRKNPNATVNVKFNAQEIAGIVSAIERGTDFSTYHTSQNQTLQIFFGRYMDRDGNQKEGYSFRVTKDVSGNKVHYILAFLPAEGRLLREYLVTALQNWSTVQFSYVKPDEGQAEHQPAHQIEVDSGPEPQAVARTDDSGW